MLTEYMNKNGFYETLSKTGVIPVVVLESCLLYTSDAADEL